MRNENKEWYKIKLHEDCWIYYINFLHSWNFRTFTENLKIATLIYFDFKTKKRAFKETPYDIFILVKSNLDDKINPIFSFRKVKKSTLLNSIRHSEELRKNINLTEIATQLRAHANIVLSFQVTIIGLIDLKIIIGDIAASTPAMHAARNTRGSHLWRGTNARIAVKRRSIRVRCAMWSSGATVSSNYTWFTFTTG